MKKLNLLGIYQKFETYCTSAIKALSATTQRLLLVLDRNPAIRINPAASKNPRPDSVQKMYFVANKQEQISYKIT